MSINTHNPYPSAPSVPAAPWRRLAALVLLIATFTGCSVPKEAVVRPEFRYYDRVAVWATLPREIEDLFIPLYMSSFPKQTLVERRDVATILGEQEILPNRLNDETRAKIRRILGVKAIILANITEQHFSIKVVDTETGAITASVYLAPQKETSMRPEGMVRAAVRSLKAAARM